MLQFAVSGIRITVSFDAASLEWSQNEKRRKRHNFSKIPITIFGMRRTEEKLKKTKQHNSHKMSTLV